MRFSSVKAVCFSPTGTTKSVAVGIAGGINPDRVDLIDVTSPEARREPLRLSATDLLVIAAPVYMGRVPELLSEWLNALEADNTLAVCVVVYGNRVYDNALLELRDIVASRGCRPIAAAAFIGEHSFSSPELPVAQGRPDTDDLRLAEAFGRKVRDKIRASADDGAVVTVPGSHPYGGVTKLWNVDFIEVNDRCTRCGVCAELCPVGAIDPRNSDVIDQEKCVTCCACIKSCPEKARTMKPGPVMDAAHRLNSLYKDRKSPECFL